MSKYKLSIDSFKSPPLADFSQAGNGAVICYIYSLPEAIEIQIEQTSKEYYKLIVCANNMFYYLSLRYKYRVEQFLFDVAKRDKNIALIIDKYKEAVAS
ncbi:MAG TPA: hypothetical protein VIL24_02405 [Clostridia bacterium]